MDESQMHYAKLQKPDLKGCILYDCLSVTFWEKQKYREKHTSAFQGQGCGGNACL